MASDTRPSRMPALRLLLTAVVTVFTMVSKSAVSVRSRVVAW